MYKYLIIGNSEILLYNLMTNLGAVMALLYVLLNFKTMRNISMNSSQIVAQRIARKNEKSKRIIINVLTVVKSVVFVLGVLVASTFNRSLGDHVGTGVNYFGVFYLTPVMWIVFCWVFKINPLKCFDILTPGLLVSLFCSKIGCFCAGCCQGVEWEHGLYNHSSGKCEIPVQLIEAFWALLIFIILIKNKKKFKEGTVFPTYAILYCSTRFFSEFLRVEVDVLWNLKTYHVLCIAGLAFGFALLFIVFAFGDKITAYYDKKEKKYTSKVEVLEMAE